MGTYCYNCRNYIYEIRRRYCSYCGADLREQALQKIKSSIKIKKIHFEIISVITVILFFGSLFLMTFLSPTVTGTSTIESKSENYGPSCVDPDGSTDCENTGSYYFHMTDGHTVDVDSSTYDSYEVGQSYTYTTKEPQRLLLLVPVIFLVAAIIFLFYFMKIKRQDAISQWDTDGTLPDVCHGEYNPENN